MKPFSLEDVRDSFSEDVRALLARADLAVEALRARAQVMEGEASAGGEDEFRLIPTASLGSALLEASSGGGTAGRGAGILGGLVLESHQQMRDCDRWLRSQRELIAACAAGVDELRAALACELDDKAEEALAVANAFSIRLDELASKSDETETPSPSTPAGDEESAVAKESLARLARLALELVQESAVLDAGSDFALSFEELTACFHAIRGTTGLLRIESLHSMSEKLEKLADTAHIEALASGVSFERLGVLLEGCIEAVALAGEIISGESQESDAGIERLLDELQSQVEGWIAWEAEVVADSEDEQQGELQYASADEGSLFASGEDEFNESEAGSLFESAQVDPEMLEIFHEEVKECRGLIEDGLKSLEEDPTNEEAAHTLERFYHQIKGAAGMIGLTGAQATALELEELFESVKEGKQELTEELLADARESTHALFAAAGLFAGDSEQALAPSRDSVLVEEASGEDFSQGLDWSEAAASAPPNIELISIFREEAVATLAEIEAYVEPIRLGAAGEVDGEVLEDLRGLFHRFKGSALTTGVNEIAEESARMQSLCDSEPGDPEAFAASVEEFIQAVRRSIEEIPAVPASLDQAFEPGQSQVSFELEREAVDLEVDPMLWEAFQIETQELLDTIERHLLDLEAGSQPKDTLAELLRCYHTLKGALNTVGLDPIGQIIHHVESLLDDLIDAEVLPPLNALARFFFKSLDDVRHNLRTASSEGYVETSPAFYLARVEALRGGGMARSTFQSGVQTGIESTFGRTAPTRSAGSKSSGSQSDSKKEERRFVRVGTDQLDKLMNLAGELVVSRSRMERRVAGLKQLQADMGTGRVRMAVAISTFRDKYEFYGLTGEKIGARRPALAAVGGGRGGGGVATMTRSTGRSVGGGGGGGGGGDFDSGDDAENVDSVFSDIELDTYGDINILARVLGEIDNDLVELHSEIRRELDVFTEESEAFANIISGLQGGVTEARMVPVDQLFLRVRGPLRDAAERERKTVRVATEGETVSLDKTIIDELYTPMLHLVRNSVSHGIESAEDRRRRGKDPTGTVSLIARQESGQIILEVSDDGGGLDLASLHRKGVERGLIQASVALDDPRVAELIFVSGLSTKHQVGAVAGRGVGCDVVRREIERLNGHIRVVTKEGQGTIFTITLPLTLAIYRALMVEQSGKTFAIPLNFVDRTLDMQEMQVVTSAGVTRVELDGEFIAIRGAGQVMNLPTPEEPRHLAVLRVGENTIAIGVDHVVGQEEIVVKSLGDMLEGHPLFSGVTIRGDGDLILIVDVPGLFQSLGGGMHQAAPMATSSLDSTSDVASKETARAPKILYIDDSLSVRKAAEKFLRDMGVQVTLAVDGLDGLEKLREGTFDMVFTDLEMPRLHGYDFIARVRKIQAYADLPLAVVTSRSGEKHRAQAKMLGANEYVTKPFSAEILEDRIKLLTGALREGNRLVLRGSN